MSILNENAQSIGETVFDHAITDDERIRLGLHTRETYLEIFEGNTASVNAHLAVLANYINASPPTSSMKSSKLSCKGFNAIWSWSKIIIIVKKRGLGRLENS